MNNNKIDWKKKLTSRKFWAAIIGFVTPTLLAFGVAHDTVTQIAGIITAGAVVIAYILGEGFIDAAQIGSINAGTLIEEDVDFGDDADA